MTTDIYLWFLGIGVAIIVADGFFLYHSGKRYLAAADGEGGETAMSRLIAVLFHIVMFGILALLSVFDFDFGDGASMRALVGNLGVLLLVLAIVHGVTIAALSNVHDNQVAEDQLASRASASTNAHIQRGPVVTPVPGQKGRDPQVSPSIEHDAL
ncbi:hypothetical protein B0I33_109135 [Prauserella shujinwangii]|uniref:Uncharacterized protein n=1 Tax=Prauserella shujinwangii TaxID=1453103 RepID=A0A2T0LQD3_9PSEU|nr:hypothetical protein [Prauserella shujinwangii]PRX45472.1 hypothetical protein B0I33_109135 [Prauserella shujinwangii]